MGNRVTELQTAVNILFVVFINPCSKVMDAAITDRQPVAGVLLLDCYYINSGPPVARPDTPATCSVNNTTFQVSR